MLTVLSHTFPQTHAHAVLVCAPVPVRLTTTTKKLPVRDEKLPRLPQNETGHHSIISLS